MDLKMITIADLSEEGLKLNHSLLYRLDDKLVDDRYHNKVAQLLDAFEGSRVDVYLVLYEDHSGAYLQLRCGEIHDDERLIASHLDDVINLAPFIAACAGKAEPEPSELEQLKARIGRIEEVLQLESTTPPELLPTNYPHLLAGDTSAKDF